MRKSDVITIGTKIATEVGEMIVTGYNGAIVYVDVYEVDEDDNLVKTAGRRLTLDEIGLEMRKVDGLNHHVICEKDA